MGIARRCARDRGSPAPFFEKELFARTPGYVFDGAVSAALPATWLAAE